MDWIIENWLALSGVALAAIALAKAVVKVTPNQNDDAIVEKVEEIVKSILGPKSE